MGRTPIDELVHIIDSEAKYITKLPQRIDPSMTEAVMKWKSLVAKACVSLVLKLASDSSDTTAEPPSSDYMIDLRAVRTTKIKKSWSTSINKRLIGGGDQLKRLFAHSRIMIFDRLGSRTEHNFVSALYQCALSKSPLHLNKIPSCATIQEACSIIQEDSTLHELNNALIATVKSYYLSNSCQNMCDGLSS
ncbi:unnamed protein product, partial [Adineta steineri]